MPSPLLLARADAPIGGVRELSPLVVVLHLPELTVVDVCAPSERGGALGGIPGARAAPPDALMSVSAGWDRAAPLLFVCRSGLRAGLCARALGRAGFSALFSLSGGMLAWDTNALPRVQDPADPAQALRATLGLAFIAACDGEVGEGAEALAEALGGDVATSSVEALGAAVAAFETRPSTPPALREGYAALLRAGLARLRVAG